jgi:hypothetical protein
MATNRHPSQATLLGSVLKKIRFHAAWPATEAEPGNITVPQKRISSAIRQTIHGSFGNSHLSIQAHAHDSRQTYGKQQRSDKDVLKDMNVD